MGAKKPLENEIYAIKQRLPIIEIQIILSGKGE
jgi:hypothetical protein